MPDPIIVLITGTRKGIGKFLAEHYLRKGHSVIGCSRKETDLSNGNYRHFCLDVSDEPKVKQMFSKIRKEYGRIDVLINNAGIASMNHILLTPVETVRRILNTNVVGTVILSRESAILMRRKRWGRIINFATIATPLKLAGESIYASSKAAIISLTQILAKELSEFGITVNAVGPAPVKTDLILSISEEKINEIFACAISVYSSFLSPTEIVNGTRIQPCSMRAKNRDIALGEKSASKTVTVPLLMSCS